MEYLENNPHILGYLRMSVVEHFYSLFEGFFERIYVASFRDFNPPDKRLTAVAAQWAIRSTSHVDSAEYTRILIDYIRTNTQS